MHSGIYTKEHKRLIQCLVKARQETGLNQTEAAKLLGHTQSYISKIEMGQRKVDVLELKKIARIYKKEITYFLQ